MELELEDMMQEDEEQTASNKKYLHESGFAELYPFAGVSFFDRETHDGVH